jgi:hypothetical protein
VGVVGGGGGGLWLCGVWRRETGTSHIGTSHPPPPLLSTLSHFSQTSQQSLFHFHTFCELRKIPRAELRSFILAFSYYCKIRMEDGVERKHNVKIKNTHAYFL